MSGSLTVSKESVLRNLASIGQQGKAGRPRSEDKVKSEMENPEKVGVDLGVEEEGGYIVPTDELFLPGEMMDFQMQLKDSKPEDLRVRTAKLTFENRGLKRWIKNAVTQLSNAEKGGKVMLPALPQGVPNALGVEDSNAGVTQMLKEIMPSITQYKIVRDMMKDEDGDSGKDKGMMEYESPDGMKVKMPAGSFMPGMFNPFMMGGQQQPGTEKKEENVTIKVGDKELTGPASSMGWMYQTVMNQQSGNNVVKEATVKIKGDDGEEREVPASALGTILDLQKMAGGAKKEQEQNITITDENGKDITMPISFYPQYLMQQTLNKQMQQQTSGGGGRRREEVTLTHGGGSGVADQATASMYGMMSEMKDTMRHVGELMNPEKVGEMAVKGLMDKVEDWNKLKSFFGGDSGEDNDVKIERLKQDAESQRIKTAEEEKTKREVQRTAQAAADARKFEILMQPQGGVAPELGEEDTPGVSLDEAYKKTKAINNEFMMGLQEVDEGELGGREGEEELGEEMDE